MNNILNELIYKVKGIKTLYLVSIFYLTLTLVYFFPMLKSAYSIPAFCDSYHDIWNLWHFYYSVKGRLNPFYSK